MKLYTKTGDAGETSLGDGRRVPKTHRRIVAYGGVDELNSLLGVVRSVGLPAPYDERLQTIQNDLFDLGADLLQGYLFGQPSAKFEEPKF